MKFYPVFCIDVYNSGYGVYYVFIGAKSKEDLREKYNEIMTKHYGDNDTFKLNVSDFVYDNYCGTGKTVDTFFENCDKVKGMVTEEPYKILLAKGYME